jgi:DNA-binding NarL/FixJ family response regulator
MVSDINELHTNFDKTFLALYPNFVTEFNSLLRNIEQYDLEKNQLNNELRIFALIKLGITDVKQIAEFLHYSAQTVYNYKSKVKAKALVESDQFEDEVMKIGSIQ